MDLSLLKPLPPEEIPRVLSKALCFGGKIKQSGPEQDHICLIKSMDFTPTGKLNIELLESEQFDPDRSLTINLAYRNVSFRLEPGQYQCSRQQLTLDLPARVHALEGRHTDRHILPQSMAVTGRLRRAEKRGLANELEMKIVDLSLSGLGIQLIGYEEEALLKHDHIWIKSIGPHQLPRPIFGRVIYVARRNFKDQQFEYRAGISLEGPLPLEIYQQLIEQCLLTLRA
jgi:hypothetical protein